MVQSHILLCFGWVLFGVVHSVLADESVKEKVRMLFPGLYSYYRLLYNIVALVSFALLLLLQFGMRSPFLFQPVSIPGYLLTLTGAMIMAICIRKYFLALSGLRAGHDGALSPNTLRIDGVHRFVRHPLYLGTFLFIWGLFFLIPQASQLISQTVITVYTLVGIRFEEQKLVAEFGSDYKKYQEQVPMIIPKLKG